eukprot:ANDGO_01845.mRNA.1 hypothetical protein
MRCVVLLVVLALLVASVAAQCPSTISTVLAAAAGTYGQICLATESTCPASLVVTSTASTITAGGNTYTPTGATSDVSCMTSSLSGAGFRYMCQIEKSAPTVGDVRVSVYYNSSSSCDSVIFMSIGRVSYASGGVTATTNVYRAITSATNAAGITNCQGCVSSSPAESFGLFPAFAVVASVAAAVFLNV